ncbi:MAG TPA: restriction endonuclease subunit S [Ignavibacteria bacterium]|nr:restriction endonuclease subunit S [Ignavibacteria bacterium]HMR41531.1 restriction endonuclease subunit S [Ignavibacteria bacterium]
MNNSVELGNIIDISKGKKVEQIFPDKERNKSVVRFIQIDDLRNDTNIKFTNNNGGIQVNINDLIIAWDGANAGTVGHNLKGIIGSTLARLRIKNENFDSRYLAKFLQSKFLYLRKQCTGATIPHISKSVLLKLKIPSPPLPEQKRIADLLDKADSIRQKRKESIALLDEFLKSVFIDMFGDPVRNEKGWEVKSFKEILKIERNQVSPEKIKNFTNYIDLESIEKESGKILNIRKVNNGFLKSSKFEFSSDHILYGKLRPYLNKVVLPHIEGICSTDILPILPKPKVANKFFISHVMRHPGFVNYATDRSAGANLPRVNPDIIYNFVCIAPPLTLQTQFAKIVRQTELTKSKMEESLREMDNQFNALIGRIFK